MRRAWFSLLAAILLLLIFASDPMLCPRAHGSTYDVTITAHCYTNATDVSVGIVMDWSPTGYSTPYTFTDLTGTHTFTVPSTDANSHRFKQWSVDSTYTTITVSSNGTYTAYYEFQLQEEPAMEWSRTFGGGMGFSVRQTSDGGYITFTDSADGFWLIKTDSSGNHEWNKTYGGGRLEASDGSGLQQTSDGGYIMVGTNGDIWLVKADSSGNHQWNKTFGGAGEQVGLSVQQTSDGGYILVGGGDPGTSWLIKTDASGNHQWNKTLVYFYPKSVRQTSDGGYIMTGSKSGDGSLVKTDASGNHQWNKTFEGRECWSVQQTIDGGYIIAAYDWIDGAGDFELIKTDSNGNNQWNKTYGGPDLDFPFSIEQTSDGGYIMAGLTHSFGAGTFETSDFWLVKTDSFGNHEWNKTYGGPGTEHALCVQQTTDGGYIISGDACIWLIKLSYTDVAVTTVTAYPTFVPRGQPIYIDVTVENEGPLQEWFEVYVYADCIVSAPPYGDEITVGNKTVSNLSPGENITLDFVWNTTGVPLGSYVISAYVPQIPSEIDTADNFKTGPIIGGISVPYSPQTADIVGLLIPIVSVILAVVLMGAAALGLFKLLMSVKLRWPRRWLKIGDHEILGGKIRPTTPICRRFHACINS